MKTCFKCHQKKPISEFYAHSQMADGCLGKCKECTKSEMRYNYRSNRSNPVWLSRERERCRRKQSERESPNETDPLTKRTGGGARRWWSCRYHSCPRSLQAHFERMSASVQRIVEMRFFIISRLVFPINQNAAFHAGFRLLSF